MASRAKKKPPFVPRRKGASWYHLDLLGTAVSNLNSANGQTRLALCVARFLGQQLQSGFHGGDGLAYTCRQFSVTTPTLLISFVVVCVF